jgi:hypothetical protein
MKGAAEAIARAKSLQDEIWATTITATRLPSRDPAAARMLLNGVEDMVRMNRNRMIALQNHPPVIVYAMLFFLGLLCSLLAGYRMSSRFTLSWLHMASFALVTSSVIYVSMDVEYPRAGLIRLDSADHVLTEIRDNMERATSRLPLPRTENQNGAKGQLGL